MCNLGSINLEKFVEDGRINFEELSRVTKLAIRLLDNVIDISDFPIERVNNASKNNRRIGLGIMGFADMLYKLRIPYNSDEGRRTATKVMKCIKHSSRRMSKKLGKMKGTFPNWDKSVWYEKGIKMRNAALTNIAPTGTIAMMHNVSSGVEPYFALAYHYKNVLGGNVSLRYFNKHLEEALRAENAYTEEIISEIEKKGSLQNIKGIPKKIRDVFVTSMDISAEDHIKMQATMQKYCDNAISKTINFPNKSSKEDIYRGYILAWELKCKGCTVYRNGSRDEQVLNLNGDDDDEVSSSLSSSSSDDDILSKKHEKISLSSSSSEIYTPSRCPECGSQSFFKSEGCDICKVCSFSKCSRK